jgi:hypothetical protein
MYIIHNIDLIVGISVAKNMVHIFSFETKEKKLLIQKQTNIKESRTCEIEDAE